MMNTQTKHFIIWLVAITILVVVVAVTLKMSSVAPLDPESTEILDIL